MKAIVVLLLLAGTSCWRMPGEDDVSVLPNTNNPALTHQTQSSTPWMPSVDY